MNSQRLASEGSPPQSIRLTTNSDTSPAPESPTSYISPKSKRRWELAATKVRSREFVKSVNDDILLFGTTHDLADANNMYKPTIDQLIEEKSQKQDWFRRITTTNQEEKDLMRGLIDPNGLFRQFWNPIMILALGYTATVMPFRIAFTDEELFGAWSLFEFGIDLLFGIDIGVNFWSIYVRPDGTFELRHRAIIKHYLRTWFILDLLACLPFSLLSLLFDGDSSQNTGKYNTLARLLRIPRMYKLLRVFRILKVVRYYKNSKLMDKLQDFLQVNSRIFKMLKFLLYVLISVHIAACIWFFTSKLSDFSYDTWVVRHGDENNSSEEQYLSAFYWACTTVVTVGYGDISAKTQMEKVVAITWMIIGGGFYSYTVGSLSSILSSLDTRDTLTAEKIARARELARETGLSNEVLHEMINAIQYRTVKTGMVWSDRHALFKEIPKDLRYEVSSTMYSGIVKDIYIFKHKEKAFVNYVMPLFSPMRIEEERALYLDGEYADEVYFVTHGRACFLVRPQKVMFKSYLKGSYFGEVEVLFCLPRQYYCACTAHTELLVLSKSHFLSVLDEFPNERKEMTRIAHERKRRDRQAFIEMTELLAIKQLRGNLKDIVGKTQIKPVSEEEDEYEDPVDRVKALTEELPSLVQGVVHSVTELEAVVSKLTKVRRRRRSSVH